MAGSHSTASAARGRVARRTWPPGRLAGRAPPRIAGRGDAAGAAATPTSSAAWASASCGELSSDVRTRVQSPLALSDDSEPEPDIAVVPGGRLRRRSPHSRASRHRSCRHLGAEGPWHQDGAVRHGGHTRVLARRASPRKSSRCTGTLRQDATPTFSESGPTASSKPLHFPGLKIPVSDILS